MKDVHKVGLVAVLVLAIVFAYYNNAFSGIGYPAPGAQQPSTSGTIFPFNPLIGQTFFRTDMNAWYTFTVTGWQPTTAPPVYGVRGTFSMFDTAYNTLDISAGLTATDVVQSFWAYRSANWILLGAHGGSGTNVEVTDADQGYVYVMMQPYSTQTYIPDIAKVLAMNARAVGSQFVDANGDNLKEVMIKWNMANVPAAASGYPSTTFTGYYLDEISASASITRGANITGATAASKISYFAPYMTMGTVKTGVAVTKIEIKCNTTLPSLASLISVNIPGKGNYQASSAGYQLTDTYQIWTYTIATDLSNALLWEYPQNSFDKQDLTFGIQTSLASDNEIVWTVNVYELNYAQTVVIESTTQQITYA